MRFNYQPRSGEELAALDPVTLAAQVDVLQILVVALAGSVYGDPVASIGGLMDDLNLQSDVVERDQDTPLTEAEAVDVRERYTAGFEAAKRHIVDILDSTVE